MQRGNSKESKESKDIIESHDNDYPSELCCSILFTRLNDLVIGDDGRFYERKAIMHRLRDNDKSPFTGKKLGFINNSVLVEQFKRIIIEWQNNNSAWQERLETQKKINQALEKQLEDLQKEKKSLEIKIPTLPADALMQSRDNSLFLEAVRQPSCSLAKYYIKKGANKNHRDPDSGATALILAVIMRVTDSEQAKDMIMMLCDEFHVDIDIKNFRGCTALHIAAGNNDEWAVEFLLNKFANPLIENEFKDTPRSFGNKVHDEKFNKTIHTKLVKAEYNFENQPTLHSLFHNQKPSKVIKELELKSDIGPGW